MREREEETGGRGRWERRRCERGQNSLPCLGENLGKGPGVCMGKECLPYQAYPAVLACPGPALASLACLACACTKDYV